jgi:hypothetical protein
MLIFPAALARHLPWINLPGAVLLGFLQRSPAVPAALLVEEGALSAPVGAVVRSAFAAAVSLGALHSLAGATRVVPSVSSVNTTVGTPITPVVFVTNGAPTIALSYLITGLPPGLATVPALNSSGILNTTDKLGSGLISGTPTIAGSYPVTIQAWEFANAKGNFSVPTTILFTIAPAGATGPPTITSQPASLTSAVGEAVTFTVGVTANPAASYQWKKNGFNIANATGASLTLPNLSKLDEGIYVVEVTNSFGTVVSAAAALAVNAFSSAPVFTTQPASQTITTGSTIVLTAVANGAPTPTYQWKRNGVDILGATSPTLVLSATTGTTAALAGNYSVVVTNTAGTATSNTATLTVITTNDPGRLSNLSVLTDITSGVPDFTVGTVIGPIGVSGTKALVVRADGPGLGALGFPGTISDPQLSLYNATNQVIASNDNWGGSAALTAAMVGVGAFALPSANSLDAVVNPTGLTWGNYSVKVSGVNGATGNVIAEIYDATPAGNFTASSPRLINVSVNKQIVAGGSLTLGFTVSGSTSKTVLIRVIGPGLVQFGYPSGSVLGDPQLTLYNSSSQVVATNDDWGADPQLVSAGARVNAFSIGSAPTKDAILLVTLPVPPPQGAGYSVKATGNANTSGFAIVEVYEVP